MMLSIQGLSARYGDAEALRGVTLGVEQGDFYGILGANGAGKTTLLRAIMGLTPPAVSGRIEFDGHDLLRLPAHRRTALGIAVVPEGRRMFSSLSIRDSLLMGAYRRGAARQRAGIDRVLALFPELADRMQQPSGSLSGGQQQMVAVGRALMSDPRVLLLDEPSLGLAPVVVQRMFDVLRDLHREQGLTVVLIEQNAREAFPLLTRAVVVERGRVVIEGDRAEVEASPAVAQAYLGQV
jgi:branched-chain amino acid transport system ATP-binding protein